MVLRLEIATILVRNNAKKVAICPRKGRRYLDMTKGEMKTQVGLFVVAKYIGFWNWYRYPAFIKYKRDILQSKDCSPNEILSKEPPFKFKPNIETDLKKYGLNNKPLNEMRDWVAVRCEFIDLIKKLSM